MAKILVVVETPFQLLCALEYLLRNDDTYRLIIRTSLVGRNDRQMMQMLSSAGIVNYTTLRVRPKKILDILANLPTIVSIFFCRYQRMVVGSFFSSLLMSLAKIACCKDITLLDDGVASLLADDIISKRLVNKFSSFSIFPLNAKSYQSLEYNNFSFIKNKLLRGKIKKEGIFFLGQDLVDDVQALTVNEYLDVIRYAANSNCSAEIIYIPHRRENLNVVRLIAAIPRVKVVPIEFAVEYHFLVIGLCPERVYSVISTALYSLLTVFPEMLSFCLIPKNLKTNLFVHYDLVINLFRSHPNTMQIIELPGS